MDQITDLIPRAEKGWASLSCAGSKKTENNKTSSDNTRFWKHEWDKHGTCSDLILDQHAYFEATLNLKDRVDLLQILQYNGNFGVLNVDLLIHCLLLMEIYERKKIILITFVKKYS